MTRDTAEWIRKAERDYRVAERLANVRPPEHDIVCFHCQQAAEKFLKALLVELGLAVPRTHNLEDLLGLLRPYHAKLGALRRGLIYLSRFAVETRYPGFSTSRRQANAARRWAEQVRATVRSTLGLRPRPRVAGR
jgi:HEPN domain-containing protein